MAPGGGRVKVNRRWTCDGGATGNVAVGIGGTTLSNGSSRPGPEGDVVMMGGEEFVKAPSGPSSAEKCRFSPCGFEDEMAGPSCGTGSTSSPSRVGGRLGGG